MSKFDELSPEKKALAQSLISECLSIQDRFKAEPLFKKQGKGHFVSKAVEEIAAAKRQMNEIPVA